MRIHKSEYGTKIWLSARDTYAWAHRPGAAWPCSQLSDRRVFAELDAHGDLVDMALDGGRGDQDCDANEFNALVSDMLRTSALVASHNSTHHNNLMDITCPLCREESPQLVEST